MELKGVHFLLTYRCDLECDHCFVWGSPKAKGVFTLKQIRNILTESKKLGTVNYVAIEGGEPFLYYPIMVKTVEEAVNLGFQRGDSFKLLLGYLSRRRRRMARSNSQSQKH